MNQYQNQKNFSPLLSIMGKKIIHLMIIIIVGLSIKNVNAEPRMTATQLIVSRGFDVQEFDLISQHTYNLKVYRIVNPLADPKTLHPEPVVAYHGVNMDMSHMMENSINARPRKPNPFDRVTLYAMENGTDDANLFFLLSNNNYDVWLLESRGSTYRAMKRLKDKRDRRRSYWDYAIDELALIDLPTQIDFVRMKTKQDKVSYIAYSQSTMFMFGLLSMQPEFSEKLVTFIALAPIAYGHHTRGLLWPIILTRSYGLSTSSSNALAPITLNKLGSFILRYLCSIDLVRRTFCSGVWSEIGGKQKTNDIRGGLVDNAVRQISIKGFEQFIHNALIKDFRMYDYKDEMRNMDDYNQTVPPRYNVSNIQLKTMVFFRGLKDYLSDPADQALLISRLKVPLYEDHVLESYGHMDFLISPTVVRDVNEPILRIIDKLSKRNVTRVLHTLGEPNQLVKGTPLVIDLQNKHGIDKQHFDNNAISSEHSTPEAEIPDKGIQGVKSNTMREQIFGKDDSDKKH